MAVQHTGHLVTLTWQAWALIVVVLTLVLMTVVGIGF
jgi:hypothetical protein